MLTTITEGQMYLLIIQQEMVQSENASGCVECSGLSLGGKYDKRIGCSDRIETMNGLHKAYTNVFASRQWCYQVFFLNFS